MKTTQRFARFARFARKPMLGRGVLAAGCVLAPWAYGPMAMAADAETATKSLEEAPKDYANWVTFSIGGAFVDGDEAAFSKRHRLEEGAFGGIEDFHYEQDVGKRGLFKFDGHGLFDLNDYSIRLELSDPDLGFVRFGYSEFRSWSDPSGGYFPANGRWFELYEDAWELDRGEFFFEAGLTKPNVPRITFHYSHTWRDGRKDSTIWGDSALTGIPGSNGVRGMTPTYLDIDETRDIFELDMQHTLGKTDVGLTLGYERLEQDNSRNISRRPGEPSDRKVTQRDGMDTDLFRAHGYSETRFNDKAWLTLGGAFVTLDSDLSGSRIYGAGFDAVYDPVFARRQNRDEGFLALNGGSNLKEYIANVNFMWLPVEHFTVTPSFRFEHQDVESASNFTETNVGSAPGLVSTQENLRSNSARDLIDLTESIDLRYQGVKNWVFYGEAEWTQGDGNQSEIEVALDHTPPTEDLLRDSDFDRMLQKYTVGANWYACKEASVSLQYYYKVREDDYTHLQDNTPNRSGNRYPAFLTGQDFRTHDINARLTLRPLQKLTLVSRYDYQESTIDMSGDGLSTQEASDRTAHIFSQSLSWTPTSRVFIQGSISYVLDETDTPADELTGPAAGMVPVVASDYWNLSAMIGYVLDDKTDVNAQYFYYRADNYVNNSAVSMPYGADAEEHGITVALTRMMRDNVRLTVRYGFFTNRDDAAGGYNDYDAHVVSSSLQFLF